MTQRTSDLIAELLASSEADRSEAAARLLESLDGGEDADAAAAWADEIAARLDDVHSGRVTPVPWAEARRQILADDVDG